MRVHKLSAEEYKGKEILFEYETEGYYHIIQDNDTFRFEKKEYNKPVVKSFTDTLFSEWLENPVCYGVYEGNVLLGLVEGAMESWNNRFRISNILVMKEYRHKGVGQVLMDTILEEAKKHKARMIVLETQTCNLKAIDFYKKNGFQIIGFDLYSYSNEDLDKQEVRIEMGKVIKMD